MQKLIDLTSKIKRWNMIGYSLLPTLELVLINGKAYQQKTENILQLFKSTELSIVNENNWSGLKKQSVEIVEGGQKQVNEEKINEAVQKQQIQKIQRIFIMGNGIQGKIFVVEGLSDTEIKDHEFRSRKKLIDKYRRKKYVIFIVFTAEDKKQIQKGQEQLLEFGLIKNMGCVILCDNLYSDTRLIHEILLKYENSFKYDLVTNYRIMKDNKKQQQKLSKRYIQWKRLLNKEENVTTFSLMSFRHYSESMRSSFSGTYSTSSHYENLGVGKSINWKVMELLHAFWSVQSDILFKEVDSFPLSYIEQQYKMSDHYSIGGFLPDTCFKAIFSPPLYQFRDSLISTVEAIKISILHHIELSISYIFQHTSVLDLFLQRQLQAIEQICNKFISQLKNSLQSQIQFIHANPQDFWNYRQLNSSFYSPDQQVYIEIKYIGKSYVRKVHESIKDAVPRMIGQGLLKKIQKYICGDAVNSFIEITKDKEFQIIMTPAEINKYESDLELLKQLDVLIAFFSLRVNASFLIKNFHQKKQKQWDRMFGRSQNVVVEQKNYEVAEKGGILNWMKKIFKRNKNQNVRRANSGQKKVQKPIQNLQSSQQKKTQASKNLLINEKNWLLIINTGRQVSHERIKLSALQGFPARFRSSIWTYLSTNKKPKSQKLKSLLQQTPDQKTVKQIEKDLPRTSPGQLFRYSMKSSLKNVLVGYSIYDKQISYTQGMNFIVAVILTTLINYGDKSSPLVDNRINYDQVEERAFCILKHIMQQCQVRKLMLIEVNMLADLSLRLSDRINQLSPKMHSLISQTPFTCEMIFSSPLISCLSNVTKDLYLMRRFLDILITHDFLVVYKIIAQFVAHCELVSAKLNVDNIYDYLKNKMYDEVYSMVGEDGLGVLFSGL